MENSNYSITLDNYKSATIDDNFNDHTPSIIIVHTT